MLTLRDQILTAIMTVIALVMSIVLLAFVFDIVGTADIRVAAAHYAHTHRATIAERN